jgi:hypothetical protein
MAVPVGNVKEGNCPASTVLRTTHPKLAILDFAGIAA